MTELPLSKITSIYVWLESIKAPQQAPSLEPFQCHSKPPTPPSPTYCERNMALQNHMALQNQRGLKRANPGSTTDKDLIRIPPPSETVVSDSLRKRLRDDDPVLPDQSVSVMSAPSARSSWMYPLASPCEPPSQPPSQPPSPCRTRNLIASFCTAKPPIFLCRPYGHSMPKSPWDLFEQLSVGLEDGVIPQALEHHIAKYPMVSGLISGSRSSVYGDSLKVEGEIEIFWDRITSILDMTRDCSENQADENRWCQMVVVPTIQLALGYSRKKDAILQLETVQSQSIRTNVLPVSLIRSNKKTDFTFSFQGNAVSPIYHRLKAAGINENIGHTIDACTSRFALFSGIEVKREGGSTEEALAELAIWLCAGLESHRQLAECTAENLLPVVGWTVVGPEWRTYMAYRALNQNGVETTFVVGPWHCISVHTEDVLGLCKLLRLIRRMEVYANSVYWPWLKKVLVGMIEQKVAGEVKV